MNAKKPMIAGTLALAALAGAALMIGGASTAAGAGEATAKIEVGGLWCASCGSIAGRVMEQVDSVTITDARYVADETAVYTVTFDDGATDAGAIATAVKNEVGYPAHVLAAPKS